MPAITDLTFENVNASDAGMIFSFANGVITLNVNTLTGDEYTGLQDLGISELMYKLRRRCGLAATAVNSQVEEPYRILSFPPFTFSPPTSEGNVGVTQIQTFVIPLADSTVRAANPPQPVTLTV